jgi:hypothetical protein
LSAGVDRTFLAWFFDWSRPELALGVQAKIELDASGTKAE